jgi:hypothetical protein
LLGRVVGSIICGKNSWYIFEDGLCIQFDGCCKVEATLPLPKKAFRKSAAASLLIKIEQRKGQTS